MSAPILAVDPQNPQPRIIARAVEVLEKGGLIAYPTDTYYGIGCDLHSKKAIDRLYELKGQDRKKPFSLLCPDLTDLAQYAVVTNYAYRTMRKLTPGSFTFILQATRLVPHYMMRKAKEVGIRVPDAVLPREISAKLGRPLVTTSATDREGNVLVDARDIKDALGDGLDLILDGGIQQNEPSTVVSLLGDAFEIIRQGKGEIPEH